MQSDGSILRYEAATAILPDGLRALALALPAAQRQTAEEFRLRAGRPFSVLGPDGEQELGTVVTPEDLEILCDRATEYSRYAAVETLREGYLSVQGGFRVGLCGTAVMKHGTNTNLRDLSSASVRIGRERPGIANALVSQLFQGTAFRNTLLLSPPGGGKTTLLRDLVRQLSNGTASSIPRRIALIDERGEVAVMVRGKPQLDVGRHTDVLDACPKALGIPIVLRAMNPQIIAVDEITLQADLEAMSMAAGCGVGLLATIHAGSVAELLEKPLYRRMLEDGVFRLAVCIAQTEQGRVYQVEELP